MDGETIENPGILTFKPGKVNEGMPWQICLDMLIRHGLPSLSAWKIYSTVAC